MSRATDCLMDAGCLKNASPAHPVEAITRAKGGGLVRTLKLWRERARQRQELRVLADSDDLLKDVGLSRYDVDREARKPSWRE